MRSWKDPRCTCASTGDLVRAAIEGVELAPCPHHEPVAAKRHAERVEGERRAAAELNRVEPTRRALAELRAEDLDAHRQAEFAAREAELAAIVDPLERTLTGLPLNSSARAFGALYGFTAAPHDHDHDDGPRAA